MEISATDLAKMVKGKVEGDGSVMLSSFAKIEEASPGSLTFLSNPKYTHFLYTTQASAVLVKDSLKLDREVSTVLIRVADPYSTIGLAAHRGKFKAPSFGNREPLFHS